MPTNWDKGGETGQMFEVKVMGKPTVNPEFFKALDALRLQQRERGRNLSIAQVLTLYEKHDLDDPTDPPGEHLSELRRAVADALGAEGETEKSVKAFSTVQVAPIDVALGIDGYIEYTDATTGKTARVTIDASLNKRKEAERDDLKADILLGELPDAVQNEAEYIEAIDRKGSEIALILMRRTAPDDLRKAA